MQKLLELTRATTNWRSQLPQRKRKFSIRHSPCPGHSAQALGLARTAFAHRSPPMAANTMPPAEPAPFPPENKPVTTGCCGGALWRRAHLPGQRYPQPAQVEVACS